MSGLGSLRGKGCQLAQLQRHEVHLLTVGGRQLYLLITVLPSREHQQAALATCIKLFAFGLRQGGEAVA